MDENILINNFPDSKSDEKKYDDWLESDFKERTFQNRNDELSQYLKNAVHFDKGYRYRIRAPQILHCSNIFDGTNCIASTFKIRQMKDNLEDSGAIYAFLYTKISDGEIVPSYYCIGPSLVSRDGEYRQRIGLCKQIHAIKKKYSDIYIELENHILRKMKEMRWNYFDEHFYPNKEKKKFEQQLISYIARSTVKLDLLICSWFATLFNVANDLLENHVNNLYMDIMGFTDATQKNKDIEFFSSLKKKFGDKVMQLRSDLNILNTTKITGLKLGQKLTPLNISEVENPLSIKYKPWREYLISRKVQDLIINGICKGYPFVGDFFYLKNINKTMFDNYIQYLKIEHSDQALYIIRKLIEARRSTYFTADEFQQMMQDDRKISKLHRSSKKKSDDTSSESLQDISIWLSQKFKTLYNKIDDPIIYGKSALIMSEVAFGTISEFVGRTWYDFLLLNSKIPVSKYYTSETGCPLFSRKFSVDLWNKYVFEYVYALLCINIRLNLIHGDFHLNNGTIHPIYYNDYFDIKKRTNDGEKYSMVYVLPNGKNYVAYSFPTLQYHSCLIDFSRSIIRPSKIDDFKDELYYEKKREKIKFLKKKDVNKFYNNQVCRVLNLYESLFPDMYSKNKHNIDLFIGAYIEKLFPLLTAFDMYKFSKETIQFFKIKLKDKINSRQFSMMNKIKKITENFLTIKLQKIMDNPILLDDPYYSETYANREIIDECFSEYLTMSTYNDEWSEKTKNEGDNLIDVCYMDNEIKFSLFGAYSERPKFLKHIYQLDKSVEIYGKDKKCSQKIKTHYENIRQQNLDMLNLIANRHVEKYL